jgi:signal transduction histidine kinase
MSDISARSRATHEFKNHLTIILGFADLLLSDEDLSTRHRADVEEIRLAAQRALALMPEITMPGDGAPSQGGA